MFTRLEVEELREDVLSLKKDFTPTPRVQGSQVESGLPENETFHEESIGPSLMNIGKSETYLKS